VDEGRHKHTPRLYLLCIHGRETKIRLWGLGPVLFARMKRAE